MNQPPCRGYDVGVLNMPQAATQHPCAVCGQSCTVIWPTEEELRSNPDALPKLAFHRNKSQRAGRDPRERTHKNRSLKGNRKKRDSKR
jgi:hypothetical protein